jgi:glycosyltransferase involved in cell wall biosynthesis
MSRGAPERGLGVSIEVSFVVIAYNERAVIGDCISSVQEQRGLDSHEIVVVDDGSTDGTGDLVRQLAVSDRALRLISHETNRGRGAARTTGVTAARGAHVAMVDADIVLPPDWWRSCFAALKDHDVAVGTAIPDGDVTYLARRFSLTPKIVPHSTLVTGSNALFRREVFDRIGYETKLREGEDVALSHEIERSGLRAVTVPGLVVEHREHRGLVSSLVWLYQSGVGASRQLERYGQLRKPDIAFLAVVSSAAVALTLRRLPARSRLLGLVGVHLTISWLHVGGKLVFRQNELGRYALAAVVDTALLAAYFSGRIAGHAQLRVATARGARRVTSVALPRTAADARSSAKQQVDLFFAAARSTRVAPERKSGGSPPKPHQRRHFALRTLLALVSMIFGGRGD